ncbi:ADP-ribosylation, partial [Phlegmacium glaucopus]
FKASWRHAGTTCPPVRRVYKIVVPKASLAGYDAYRAAVESRGQFVSTGRSAGNENRRWHGTRRICNVGDKGHTQFCSAPTCSLCCIMCTSFDVSLWGRTTGWGRFGQGIYTSSTSSKSDDYSYNDCKSQLKAMLLNKVVVGKGCKLLQDNTSLTSPPAGYDSVLAEKDKGWSLNYDELVVYDNDAIRPSFLVMYEHKLIRETLCLMCLQAPKRSKSHFCSQSCIDDAENEGPMILEVPFGHVTFKSVTEQFKASWRHAGTTCPPVRRVYKIV